MKTHSLARCLILLSLFCSAALPLAAADWPQWRGPHRDAHSSEGSQLKRMSRVE